MVKEAKWATQAEYKGPKDNGKLTTTWMFSSPDGSVKWETEGKSGTGKITGGSKTQKADVVTVKGTLCGTSLENVTMTSKASFKKGNTEYFVSCKK